MSYRIAGRVAPAADLTTVQSESHFARCIRELFQKIQPRRLIETGTYHGTGTTAVIASALSETRIEDATFFSIEVNPRNYQRALTNTERLKLNVSVLNGLSVPRRLLPSLREIEKLLVHQVEAEDLYVDHEELQRAALYFRETDFPELPDDLLRKCLREFDFQLDFVLLDSAGHTGHIEFTYLLSLLRGPCWMALDDIYHVKHHRSFRELQADPRFELAVASEEKFGFCIARFVPNS